MKLIVIAILISILTCCRQSTDDSLSIANTGIFLALNRASGESEVQLIRHEDDGENSEASVDRNSLARLFSVENTDSVRVYRKLLNVAGIEVKIYGVSFWIEEYLGGIYGIEGRYFRLKSIPPELNPFFSGSP